MTDRDLHVPTGGALCAYWLIVSVNGTTNEYNWTVSATDEPITGRREAAPPRQHEHHWTDAPDDEEAWYCPSCGVTEYPDDWTRADSATDEPLPVGCGPISWSQVASFLGVAASATDEGRPDHCPGCDGNHA